VVLLLKNEMIVLPFLVVEVLWILLIVGAVLWPPMLMAGKYKKWGMYYKAVKKVLKLRYMPPPWFYSIMWCLAYSIIIIVGCLYLFSPHLDEGWTGNIGTTGASATFATIIILYFINLTFVHYWPMVFFKMKCYWASCVICILAMGTAAVASGFMFYDVYTSPIHTSDHYAKEVLAAAILYSFYTIWLIVAVVLNVIIAGYKVSIFGMYGPGLVQFARDVNKEMAYRMDKMKNGTIRDIVMWHEMNPGKVVVGDRVGPCHRWK
jgi:tryptophan-rich sensory protein